MLELENKSSHLKLLIYYHEHPEAFLFRYEDYVDSNFSRINDYLGLNLERVENVPQKRVVRSKSYGSWKDWFTQEDVRHYRMLFDVFMRNFS
jgi:hypothetical protein